MAEDRSDRGLEPDMRSEQELEPDMRSEDSVTGSNPSKHRKELPKGLKVIGYFATILIAILAFSYLAWVLWFQIRIHPIRIESDAAVESIIEEIEISGTLDVDGESRAYNYRLTEKDEIQHFIQVTKDIRASRVLGYEGYEVKSGGRCGVWITYQQSEGNDQTKYFLVDGNVLKIEDGSDPLYHMTEDAYQSWWDYIEWQYQLEQVSEG